MENDIIKFLLGEGSFDGVWFGDKHPTENGAFWWRKHLRQYGAQTQPNSSNTNVVWGGDKVRESIKRAQEYLDWLKSDNKKNTPTEPLPAEVMVKGVCDGCGIPNYLKKDKDGFEWCFNCNDECA